MSTPLELQSVESSMILAAGYDRAAHELEIVFRSGGVWRYRNVPMQVFDELLASESKGTYMNQCVIGHYSFYRIT